MGGSKYYDIVIPAFASRRSPCRNLLFMQLRRFLHGLRLEANAGMTVFRTTIMTNNI